jgi:hypothetical protein
MIEAEGTLKELYASAKDAEPEFSTRALFELAQINERRGDWVMALAQFKECEIQSKDLPGFKAQLELPSRMAGLYAALGELKLSEAYAKRAEMNLQSYLQRVSLESQRSWWAETFFRMGSFPVQFMNDENWNEFAHRFHSTSQYLVRSMELSDPLWSQKSFDLAHTFFKSSFERLVLTADSQENAVLLGARMKDRMIFLDEMMTKLEIYKPLKSSSSGPVVSFYSALDLYKDQLKAKLVQLKDSAPLSHESEKRNSIVRDVKLKDSPAVDKSKKDPNL